MWGGRGGSSYVHARGARGKPRWGVALGLWAVFGVLGVHRFYTRSPRVVIVIIIIIMIMVMIMSMISFTITITIFITAFWTSPTPRPRRSGATGPALAGEAGDHDGRASPATSRWLKHLCSTRLAPPASLCPTRLRFGATRLVHTAHLRRP